MEYGLYIHIPFCRHKCVYCDFVSGTNFQLKDRFIASLTDEISERARGLTIRTIYIGGGTPSMLPAEDVSRIIAKVTSVAEVNPDAEITMEVNPEDFTMEYASAIKRLTPVNRLSIGFESADDSILRWMERRHSADDAFRSVENAVNAGFGNISADIIFAIPSQTLQSVDDTLTRLTDAGIQHISCYSLMFEEGSKITKKHFKPADEGLSSEMYALICRRLKEAGYLHYEISNWAKPGFMSRHNSGYWDLTPYIGVGPAAHSYDGGSVRRANVPSTVKYIKSREFTTEKLSDVDSFNETIMLGLRTSRGVDVNLMKSRFPSQWVDEMTGTARKNRWIDISGEGMMRLHEEGWYLADEIISSLFRIS